MKTFTIENENNNITLHATVQEARRVANAESFSDEAGLAKLAANWPAARLVEIWNSLPGAVPVRKFKDRTAAATRIWKAIQTLGEPLKAVVPEYREPAPGTHLAPQTPDAAPEQAPATTVRTGKTRPPRLALKTTTREGSKTDAIVALMKQPGGTTLKAIMDATTWQAHSVRGFISGTLGRKMGLAVLSTKGEKGVRNYSIAA